MLINLSNHPTILWSANQTETANREFGNVVDINFPQIDPSDDLPQIKKIAAEFVNRINKLFLQSNDSNNAVHIMGEFTFTFNLLEILKENNITAVASTTSREVVMDENGNKVSKFNFIRFRKYY